MELRQNNVVKFKTSKRQVDFDDELSDSNLDKIIEDDRVDKTIRQLKVLAKKKPSKAGTTDENIHKDHRKRLKAQFLENGLSSLTDVQKLELLLFFSIPQKDTNPLAHKLLSEFGSLRDVLTAEPTLLSKVSGIKENSAILLNLVSSLFNVISKPDPNEYVGSTSKAKEFCTKLYAGVEVEQFYVLCLTKSNRVKKYKLMKTGTVDEVNIQIRAITQFAIEENCSRIIVSHNHPAGIGAISDEDCRFTYSLICSCLLNSIEIVDHIIVGTDKTISMYAQNVLNKLKERAFERLQLPSEKRLITSDVAEEYIAD